MATKEPGVELPDQLAIRNLRQIWVFLGALFPGVIAILISRYLELSGAKFLVVAVSIPSICMFSYLGLNFWAEFFDSTRAQVADNIYFLGFLYFLVSLAATLVLFSQRVVNEQLVVQGFGIALVTTILGLLLRIVVLQHTAPIEDAREQAERDLLAAIQQSRINITAGNEELRRSQMLAMAGLAETSRLLVEKTAATADEMNRRVTAAAASIDERLKSVEIPPDVLTRAFRPLLEELRGAVGEFVQSAKEQALAGRDLAGNVRTLVPPMQNTVQTLGALNQAIEQARPGLEAMARSIGSSAAASDSVARATDAAKSSMEGVAQSVTILHDRVRSLQLDAGLERTGAQVKNIQAELTALTRAIGEGIPAIGQAVSGLPALAEKLSGAAGEIERAATATRALVEAVERREGADAIRGVLAEAGKVVEQLRSLQATLATQVERVRAASVSSPVPQGLPGRPSTATEQVPHATSGGPSRPGLFGWWRK